MDNIKKSWLVDEECSRLITELTEGRGPSRFSWVDGLLRRKGKVVVDRDLELRKTILELLHASAVRGHSGASTTLQKVSSVLYWKGLKKNVREFVQNC